MDVRLNFVLQSSPLSGYTRLQMAVIRPIRKEPVALHSQAIDNLEFIRSTMERSGSFTAVPGLGGMLMGATALFAAFAAHLAKSPKAWLAIWAGEAMLAFAIGLAFSYRKAMREGNPLVSRTFRRFVLAMAPSAFVGAMLTVMLYRDGQQALLPSMWLLLYGLGVSSAGAFSVRAVPLMGVGFLVLGGVAAFSPAGWGDGLMAVGFGGLHLAVGYLIARHFGG